MEEVDSIIIGSLREVGCDIEDDVKLKNLSPEEVYKSISILVKIIKADIDISYKILPIQMAQRFSAASQLVDACKSLGYNGDLGKKEVHNIIILAKIQHLLYRISNDTLFANQ